MILNDIHSPEDLKLIPKKLLPSLAKEIRSKIIEVVGHNGGHLASNLGVVELSIALHRSFSSPQDAIIWDVSHQCYPHKILTGRYDLFSSIRMKENNPMFNSDTINKMKETIQKHIADGTITYKHGSEHWLWKGNRELNGYVRVGLRKWVKHMFENAHFTCQHCGKTHTELQVHHTKPLRNIISEFLDKHNYTIEYMNSIIGSKEYNNFIQEIIDYHF